MYRVGIDVGGTFTDLVAVDDEGVVTLTKVPSTPADPSQGVVEGLDRLAQEVGLDLGSLLDATERIVHGTTVATNALLERKGAKIGLLTTEGHRDILPMREGLKDERYNLRIGPPEPLVTRALSIGVHERLRCDGSVEIPLARRSLETALRLFKREAVEAVAICYLHAYRDARIHTLGAGGGSIAWVDPGGILHVGPKSAGADPGPACYGRGGMWATVTDANLVLGYLDAANFLGGRSRLDIDAALGAVTAVAQRLGTTPVAAAEGIFGVVNTKTTEGISVVSVRRGVDPRRFTVLAFGGAAGLHVTAVARTLDIGRVVVPRVAAVLSAWGMLSTDLRYEFVRTHVSPADERHADSVRRLFDAMESEGRQRLGDTFPGRIVIRRSLDMRLGEQIFEVSVPLDGIPLEARDLMSRIVDRFHRRHEELYGYSAQGHETVIINARLAIVGCVPTLPTEPLLGGGSGMTPKAERRVYLGAWISVPVYEFETVVPGVVVNGPAMFESATTTVLVRAGERVTVTPHGWLDIRLR